MAQAPLVNIDALLAPIPGANPAGVSMPLTARQKLESFRRDFEPHPDNPSLAPIAKKPEWISIVRMCEDLLTKTSKDLEIAIRLTEALVKLHGFDGFRSGFELLIGLVQSCWDRIHPIPDEDEGMEVRAARFYWLSEPEKGARFLSTVQSIPLVRAKDQLLSYLDLQTAFKDAASSSAAMAGATLAQENLPQLLNQCDELVRTLEKVLQEKCAGAETPTFQPLEQAIADCQKILAKAVPTAVSSAPVNAGGGNSAGTDAARFAAESNGRAPLAAIQSREEAYRQLGHIANVLESLEPHSPIPDLLRRAIELGRMPFRQLVRELVRDNNLLTEIRREFGIREPKETEK